MMAAVIRGPIMEGLVMEERGTQRGGGSPGARTPNSAARLRVLVLLGTQYFPPFIDQLAELNADGKGPRQWLFDLDGEVTQLDQRFLTRPPAWLLAVYRRMPIWAAQAAEAFRVRHDYDVVFAWGAEPVAMTLALMLKLARSRVPLVALFNWISPAKKAWFLRAVGSHMTKLILPPVTQQEFAVNRLRMPPGKVADIPWPIDVEFWQPSRDEVPDMICAAGREMRDYETLIKALDGTGIPCHIAGGLVRGKQDRWRRALGDSGEKAALPANVTVGPKSPVELRDLYARSRFVVLPLYQSDTDNGITCMLEAWSMSRAVICSQIDGQRGALDHGRNGLFVPPGDAEALRKAVVDLWDHPEESARMGREGRRAVLERRRMDRFAREVSAVLRDAASSHT
jgi:glycosyltransferase involved in cell wall biosynthesis